MSASTTSTCISRNPAATRAESIACRGQRLRLLRRLDPQHRSLLLIRQQVQEAVGPLPHVADALAEIDEQRLAPQLLPFLVEENALEMSSAWDLARAQRSHEHVALPLRQLVTGVERHS